MRVRIHVGMLETSSMNNAVSMTFGASAVQLHGKWETKGTARLLPAALAVGDYCASLRRYGLLTLLVSVSTVQRDSIIGKKKRRHSMPGSRRSRVRKKAGRD